MPSARGYTELQTFEPSPSAEDATNSSPSLDSLPSSSNIAGEPQEEHLEEAQHGELNGSPSRLTSLSRWAGRLMGQGRTRYSSLRAGGIVDGVFGNLIAKDDARNTNADGNAHEDDELNGGILISNEDDMPTSQPPSYGEAAADSSPSYWETTMSAFEYADDVAINGMLVGSFLHFGWNALIATAFGEVGFFLTYLFHSTHAACAGSLLGFGFTLIQIGIAYQGQIKVVPRDYTSEFYPSDPNGPDTGGTLAGTVFTTLMGQEGQPQQLTSAAHKTAICVLLYTVAGMFILKGFHGFWWADRRRRLLFRRQREPIESQAADEVQYVQQDHHAPGESPV